MKAEKTMRIVTMKLQTIVIALLIVGAGLLYLGFQGADSTLSPVEKVTQNDGQDALVGPLNTSGDTDGLQSALSDSPQKQGSEPSLSGEEFFIQFRLDRDRVRSQEIDMLQETVDNSNSTAETRQEAQKRLLQMTSIMEQEMQLENLIKAKGFKDAAIFVQQGGVTVIIQAANLSQEDASKAADLVARTTGQKMEDIVVIPKG